VTEFKKGRGLPGRVMADCRPHWIKDVTKDHDFHRKQIAKELGIKAGFAFPVMVETKVVAVLEFFSTEAVESDNKLLEVVLDMGTHLGRVFERKRTQEEHIRTQKLESIGILAGGIAHDFNNYLQGILSNIAIVKSHIDSNDKIYNNLIESEKAVIQSKQLSKQLLTFSKGGDPIKETICVSELIKDSCKFATSGSNVGCKFNIPDCSCLIKADKGQMNQVFNNLFINADQSMPKGGVIKVTVEDYNVDKKGLLPLQEGRYVKITVKDQGTGMSQKNLQKIFDPYFTTKDKGSGLGLAIAFSIIKKHDGYITVESKIGDGTSFYIYLPASDEKIREKSAQEGAEEVWPESVKGKVEDVKSTTIKGRVLLMDDEGLIRLAVAQHIKNIKYEVETAKDGTEAIELYIKAMKSGKPFDIVIIDLTIPGGMGGKKAIQELLKIDPDVKSIVSSGYSNDPVMADFSKYGFSGVLAKPYEMYELDDVLREVMRKKES
jgi:signal transduction histidine kinase/ActR/RegA family two-component response regulator